MQKTQIPCVASMFSSCGFYKGISFVIAKITEYLRVEKSTGTSSELLLNGGMSKVI